MNIPDVIILPPTVIKVATEQTIVVKNTGNMDFNFSQMTEKPIFTNLVNGILPPNEIFELTYRCYPIKTGQNKGKIKIYFRQDFCLLIDIECEVSSTKQSHYNNKYLKMKLFLKCNLNILKNRYYSVFEKVLRLFLL